MNAALYPVDWPEISHRIRARAGGQCECLGTCGLHNRNPGPRRCEELNGDPAKWAKGKVVLTVAHLNSRGGPCQCEPLCGNEKHLKAMCQRCHNRMDRPMRGRNAATTRQKKQEAAGQGRLL